MRILHRRFPVHFGLQSGRRPLFVLMFPVASIVFSMQQSVRASETLVIESALVRLTQKVSVPAQAQGVLSSLAVVEGDYVQQGTILAHVDNSEAQLMKGRAAIELKLGQEKGANDAALRAARKSLEFSEAEFKRLERAARAAPGSVSTSELAEVKFRAEKAVIDLDEAQYERRVDQLNVDLKQQELEIAQRNVDIRQIIAPLTGIVVEVLRQPGEWVEPGEKVLRIVRIDRLRVEGLVHIDNLKSDLRGSSVSVDIDLPGKGMTSFPGKVTFVSPEINPVNGQVRLWANVDNIDGLLKPGLRPRMTILPPSAADQEHASKSTAASTPN